MKVGGVVNEGESGRKLFDSHTKDRKVGKV